MQNSLKHEFKGKWITNEEFAFLEPRNVFHKQLEPIEFPCDEHRNRHILFRKKVSIGKFKEAKIYISADDYYKLYINGHFVAQGPTPAYHFRYNYNVIDVSGFLKQGENTIAVHTLYQGLINRVWQSGDNRHGLILDLVVDGKTAAQSDETFKTNYHSGYTEKGVCGYETQFLERYDSGSSEIGFEAVSYDDSLWENTKIKQFADYTLKEQESAMLVFEKIKPATCLNKENSVFYDFGGVFVGYFSVTAKGKKGDVLKIRCGQELNDDGSLRYKLRANCVYEEEWVLSGNEDTIDWFDYKSFRYVEVILPEGVELENPFVTAKHYPFTLKTPLKSEFSSDENLKKIWELCVRTQKYGVQEVIQDCMEREKGFYLGDGCYTALTNMILTRDDSMVRRLIDDAFATNFISDTLVTCMNCSFMQEIAEYPLMLIFLVLWHYRFTGDKDYLKSNFPKVKKLLDAYKRDYERGYLLKNLDKWCVVEWPKNFQHDYDVDITEGKICEEAHVSLNAYYLYAVKTANKIAEALGEKCYRDEEPLVSAFVKAFYDEEKHLFKDGENTNHISFVGNCFVFGFDLFSDEAFKENFLKELKGNGIHSVSFFCAFCVLLGLIVNNRQDLVKRELLDEGAWIRMLKEDATTTFEGWGRDTKWNTSLFHLTMSYAAVFMAETDLEKLFN